MTDGNQQRYRILIQILLGCIEQVRQNGHFQYLTGEQQNSILRDAWFEVFLLRAACWTIDVVPIIVEDIRLKSAIERIQGLQLDQTEMCSMETLILFRKDLGRNQEIVGQLELVNESALLSLGRYILHKGHPWHRFGRLILALRAMGDQVQSNSFIYRILKDSLNTIIFS